MRERTTNFLERCRVKTGPFRSSWETTGWNGAYFIPIPQGGPTFKVICSDGSEAAELGISCPWEHVSVSLPNRCPTWGEMCAIKDLFWREDECVMQLHPPKSAYVNNVRTCLHLWKPTNRPIPQPPDWTVGIKELGVIE